MLLTALTLLIGMRGGALTPRLVGSDLQNQLTCGKSLSLVLSRNPTAFQVFAPETAMLTVTEQGREVLYDSGQGWQPIALPGARLGERFEFLSKNATFSIQLKSATTPSATASVTLDCRPSSFTRWSWLKNAQFIAESYDYSHPALPKIGEIEALSSAAFGSKERAYAIHIRANANYRLNNLAESLDDFREAATLWLEVGQLDRAGAALLGAADLARLLSKRELSESLSRDSLQYLGSPNLAYLRTRSMENHCHALESGGSKALEAANCFADLVSRYSALDEANDALNSAVNALNSGREAGRRFDPKEVASALTQMMGTDSVGPLYRGRLSLSLAQLQQSQGRLADAMRSYALALKFFSQATEESERWQSITLAQLSLLYGQLGMTDQSYLMITEALRLQIPNAATSPDVIGNILAVLGQIDIISGRTKRAVHWLDAAAEIYRRNEMFAWSNAALLGRYELEINDSNEVALKLESAIEKLVPLSETKIARKRILQSLIAAATGDLGDAQKMLDSVQTSSLSVEDQNRRSLADSRLALLRGERASASEKLLDRLLQISVLAEQAPSAALGYTIIRTGLPLRSFWIQEFLTSSTSVEEAFKVAMRTNSSRLLSVADAGSMESQAQSFTSNTDINFLNALTQIDNHELRDKASQIPKLSALQKHLGADALMLILVPGETRSLGIWISRSSAKLVPLASKSAISGNLAALQSTLVNASGNSKDINAAAARISDQLFLGAPTTVPKQLLVVADDFSSSVPFSLLNWPDSSAPMVETTTVSLLTGLRVASKNQLQIDAAERKSLVFLSPFDPATWTGKGFSPLISASNESRQISAASGRVLDEKLGLMASRAAFVAALDAPGQWIHLATHGNADPGVLGNAGVWLNQSAKQSEFFSWLDAMAYPIRAQVLVLNACQSAQGGSPTGQLNASFALAMSSYGIKHTIAALWPVSDAASQTWVPEFYSHMNAQDGSGSAAALQAAQNKLRASLHFRHPYYWASMVHFESLTF